MMKRSAILLCLLDKILFHDDMIAHHRFRLVDLTPIGRPKESADSPAVYIC
jgi:hypothetical protein